MLDITNRNNYLQFKKKYCYGCRLVLYFNLYMEYKLNTNIVHYNILFHFVKTFCTPSYSQVYILK